MGAPWVHNWPDSMPCMSETAKMSLRLSPAQRKILQRLSRKLQIDQTNVIRLAISRLAEAEGLLPEDRK